MGRMENKQALVTGGSSGIGRAIVQRLAADGYHVTFTWHNNEPAAPTAIQADLSTIRGIDQFLDQVKGNSFDVVVNNATTVTEIAPITDTALESWQENFAIGVTAPFMLIKELGPLMPSGASIINISSLNTLMPQPGIAGYCAAKAALESLTQVAAKEFAPQGVTVNALRPGPTDTPGNHAVNPDPAVREQIAARIPMGRYGQPEDVANVVSFLASAAARWVTGQVLSVSGGL